MNCQIIVSQLLNVAQALPQHKCVCCFWIGSLSKFKTRVALSQKVCPPLPCAIL